MSVLKPIEPETEDPSDTWMRDNIRCCSCGRYLKKKITRFLNNITLHKLATWIYPVWKNMRLPGMPDCAMAIICDRCLQSQKTIIFAVEFEGGEKDITNSKVLYHLTRNLLPLPSEWVHKLQTLHDIDMQQFRGGFRFGS